jgi:hypothetical protein
LARRQTNPGEEWLWYAWRTPDCTPLDRDAYPTTLFDGEPMPWPDWACRAPNGGIHMDNRVGQIDIHVAAAPSPKDEVSWTCEFQVFLLARRWLETIEDLIDPTRIFVGRLYLEGRELQDWVTIHEPSAPLMMMKDGHRKLCPICGADNSVFYTGAFFSDPTMLGRPLIVGGKGLYVRREEAEERGLRTPAGTFKPIGVRYRETDEPKTMGS